MQQGAGEKEQAIADASQGPAVAMATASELGIFGSAARVAESVGGKVEAVYFAFGADDFFVVLDLPDSATAAAISVAAHQTGTVTSRMILLMNAGRDGRALKKNVQFRPPGA